VKIENVIWLQGVGDKLASKRGVETCEVEEVFSNRCKFRFDVLVEHFDTHDWGDYIEQMAEVEFEMDVKRKVRLVALDAELAGKLTEFARNRQSSSEALVDAWVREKVLAHG
jgi:hypothetical protein